MKQWILMLVAALGLNGCTNLMELQAPKVSVTSVRPVAGKGLLPNFEIDLHLSNPNDQELSLRGASNALSLEGNPLVSGVASKLPALPAYGETDVTLTAVPDVAGALGLAQTLMQGADISKLRYHVEARLDIAAALPDIVIEKEGTLDKLQPQKSR